MADNNNSTEPSLRADSHHYVEKYAPKLLDKTEKYQQKAGAAKASTNGEKGPAGGYDSTPVPKAPPGYTIKITFHRAVNLPFADMPTFSSDPYILAVLQTDLPKRHKQDSDLRLRTPTVHRDTNPTWNTVWTIAHIPASGFNLKCRLYDEDPADHDDRLGNVHVDVDRIDDNWKGFKERKFEIKKRMGSKRAYTIRGCATLLSGQMQLGGEVYISVENLGRSEGNGGRAYTISPLAWSQHFSPLIGLIAGTKDRTAGKNGKKATERYNFQAIQMQFQGPVPEHLYHRYVEFRPFVAGMFTSHTLRGRILNHALHHQHARIYNYDGSTKYGEFEEPSIEMTKKFLELVHYDQGGRIFTYVVTLDGQMRFTETGKEFGIDLLSKHTMHSDVSIYIAFSGEFFVRRLKHPHKSKTGSPDPGSEIVIPMTEEPEAKEKEKVPDRQVNHGQTRPRHSDSLSVPGMDSSRNLASQSSARRSFSPFRLRSLSTTSVNSHLSQTHEADDPKDDPAYYELIIDNDSGTYRPNAQYLGQLKKFLQRNLPGLRIATLDSQGDAERMSKLKTEQRERKKKSGQQIMYMQNRSSSSLSSSDEDELERRAATIDDDAELEAKSPIVEAVKHQWHNAKKIAKSATSDPTPKTPVAASAEGPSSTKKDRPTLPQASLSTTGKASFDTAPEHGDHHFVTPKPSLGDGGLNALQEEDRPLSRGIDEELKKRGLDRMSMDRDRTETTNSVGETNGHVEIPSTHPGSPSLTITAAA